MESSKKILVIILLFTIVTPLYGVYSSEYINYDEVNNIVTLYPTGTDDTENLISAFETVIAGGPGGTVQLLEGEYTISREIVVVNFDGTFKGAGIHKTLLKNEYTEEWPHRTEKYFSEVAGLFLFYQTDELVHNYHVSDMKILVQGQTTEYSSFFGMNVFDIVGRVNGDKTDLYVTEMNTHIENVFFQGNKIDVWHDGNIVNPWQFGGEFVVTDSFYFKPITGTHVVRNCIFDTAAGPKPNGMNGYLLIENNIIRNTLLGGILYDSSFNADESHVEFRNNTISNVGMMGYWLFGADNILFESNVISNSSGNGLYLLRCHNNTFKNNKISNCAQGVSMESSNGNIFTDNTFEDNGVDFFWEGEGGEMYIDIDSEHYTVAVSNSTHVRAEGLREDVNKLNVELEDLEIELESERSNVADLESQLEDKTSELEEASDDITQLESELGEAESEIVDLNTQLDAKYALSSVVMIAVGLAAISGIIVYLITRRSQ